MTDPKPATPATDEEIAKMARNVAPCFNDVLALIARIAADAEIIKARDEQIERLENRSGCEHCSDRRRVAEAELATAREQVRVLREALGELLMSPATFSDPRVSYQAHQVDLVTIDQARAALAATETKG
jgi:hypothetical protein